MVAVTFSSISKSTAHTPKSTAEKKKPELKEKKTKKKQMTRERERERKRRRKKRRNEQSNFELLIHSYLKFFELFSPFLIFARRVNSTRGARFSPVSRALSWLGVCLWRRSRVPLVRSFYSHKSLSHSLSSYRRLRPHRRRRCSFIRSFRSFGSLFHRFFCLFFILSLRFPFRVS